MKTINIVIPYVHKKAASNELQMVLRSIEANFKTPHSVILVGDLPEWASQELAKNHIPVKLIEGMHHAHCLDVNNKIKTFLYRPGHNDEDEFIYTYDDIIFLNPVKKSDISRLKADSHIDSVEFILKNSTGSRKWNNLLITTFNYLHANGFNTFNYETHLPRIFQIGNLCEVFQLPEFSIDPFLFSTVYFNMWSNGKPVIIGSEKCDIKTTIYSDNLTRSKIHDLCRNKLFLNFNSKGYSHAMQKYLSNRFPVKSIYEL